MSFKTYQNKQERSILDIERFNRNARVQAFNEDEIQRKQFQTESQQTDPLETEADDAAQKIVHGEGIDSTSLSSTNAEPQTKHDDLSQGLEKSISPQLEGNNGGGQPLDDTTKSEMEDKMNTDLSDVNIYTDANANKMSEDIIAKAFTHGQDIYFKDGNYDPDSVEGKKLLGHVLAHTQQQGKDGVNRKVQRRIDDELYLRLNSSDPGERLSALNEAFNMGGEGWDFLIERYGVVYWSDVIGWIQEKARTNIEFQEYLRQSAHEEINNKGNNSIEILADAGLSNLIDKEYLHELVVAELVAIRENAFDLAGSDTFLIEQKDRFVERINKLLLFINENELTLVDLIDIRKQISTYHETTGELDTILAIITLYGYNKDIPESFEWKKSNNVQDRLRDIHQQYLTAIFSEFFHLSPTQYSGSLLAPLDFSIQRSEIMSSIGPQVIHGTIEDIDTQLQILEVKFQELIDAMEEDDSNETVVQLNLVRLVYQKFQAVRSSFADETNTLLSSEDTKLGKEFEEFKVRFSEQIADMTGLLMVSSFGFTINSLINLQEDSWQFIDKNSVETIGHKKTLQNALSEIIQIVIENKGDPSEMIPLLQKIAESPEYKAAFDYFKEFANEEEEHRMWVGLAIAIVITFLSILGGFILQSAVPALLSSLAVRTGSMLLVDAAIVSATTLPALAINSLGFVVTNKILMQALTGDGDWDSFVEDYIYTLITFGALKASGSVYKSLVNPNIGAAFYKGGQFAVELATLEGVSVALIAWENRDLPEDKKKELFSWEGLTENTVFLLILKGSLLAISKKGIPFLERMNQSTRENIMSMRKDIKFQQENIREKDSPSTTDIQVLHDKTVELMKLEKKGVLEVYNSGSYKELPQPNETEIQKSEREKRDQVTGENLLLLSESIESNIEDMNKIMSLEKYNITPANKSGSIIYFEGDPVEFEKNLNTRGGKTLDGKLTPVEEQGTTLLYQYELDGNTTYIIQKTPFSKGTLYPYQTAETLGYKFSDVQRAFWQQLIIRNGGTEGIDLNKIGDESTNLLIQEAMDLGWEPGESLPEEIMTKLSSGESSIYYIRFIETDPELIDRNKEGDDYVAKGFQKASNLNIVSPSSDLSPYDLAEFVLGEGGWNKAVEAFWSSPITAGFESLKGNPKVNQLIKELIQNGWQPGNPVPESYRKKLSGIEKNEIKEPNNTIEAIENVKSWKESLQSREAPSSSNNYKFQIKQCGPKEYRATNGEVSIWADGINSEKLAFEEAKYIGSLEKSPFIDGSDIPEFIREKIRAEVENEFFRYFELIFSDNIPVNKLIVYINTEKARPYFERLLFKYNIPGEILLREL